MRNVVQNEGLKEGMRATLDELAREGARRMIEAALQVEVDDYLARFRAERDGDGCALVVRNGRSSPDSCVEAPHACIMQLSTSVTSPSSSRRVRMAS